MVLPNISYLTGTQSYRSFHPSPPCQSIASLSILSTLLKILSYLDSLFPVQGHHKRFYISESICRQSYTIPTQIEQVQYSLVDLTISPIVPIILTFLCQGVPQSSGQRTTLWLGNPSSSLPIHRLSTYIITQYPTLKS